MEKQHIISILQNTDLFNALTLDALQNLVEVSKVISLNNHDVLFDYGANGDAMYVILSGQIQIYRHELLLSTLYSPEYLGELSLIDPKPRSASARALGETYLLQISHYDFCNFLASERQSVISMMKTLSSRVRVATEQLDHAYHEVNHLVHDIKNKLSPLGFASILARQFKEGDKEKRYLNIITTTKNELETLIQSALLSAKGVNSEYSKQDTLISDLLNECIEQDLALSPDLKEISVKVHKLTNMKSIFLNYIDIKRVMVNLLVNAAQASKPGQHIDIHTKQEEGQTWVIVQDYGCGIAEENIALIFEDHFTSKKYGNGFGLAACKKIIETFHQGKIVVESNIGTGTIISFSIPG